YTSHYMEEVEFLCNRVAIMDLGKIIAQGTQNELRLLVGEMDSLKITTIDEMPKSLGEIIKKVSEINEVKIADRTVEILTLQGRKVLPKIMELLGNNSIRIKSVEVEEPNLESLFLHLTGKELRD
ncbi:MAG: export ABC transporter ATP-binding protein, partial [Candidatus Atribacteria bacterium]|nr:export ABC transporter ATP-binding protein [Candidatus Atribacteria bacterium]